MIRYVRTCAIRPHRCALLPQLGASHPDGYFDFHTELPGGDHVYVSVVAARHMAAAMGLVQPQEAAAAKRRLEVATGEVIAAHERIEELERILGAIKLVQEATT